ncbi:hypothetical protein B0H12DRAFT_84972 [Mycena haematopus]|nr:hypothetical protein B0H12DRAFT_84972 [Mycena haematopus]
MMHGWPGKGSSRFAAIIHTCIPGSFQEFLPVIKPLTGLWTSSAGKRISFDVVVPSLPGFLFSSPPPQDWTTNDTARIFNTLRYSRYSTDRVYLEPHSPFFVPQARSRSQAILYTVQYQCTCRQPEPIPFVAPTPDEIAAENITLSDIAKVTEGRTMDYPARGMGYFFYRADIPT